MDKIGSGLGQKSSKGSVSITNCKGRIRLRWRYQDKRYSISLSSYNKTNLLQARKLSVQIEQDMVMENFDESLVKYGGKKNKPLQKELSIVSLFEQWTSSYKQMDCEVHTNYNSTRNMIRKWGNVTNNNILSKLNTEIFCAGTYNRRLSILKDFINWLIENKIWETNPLVSVNHKKIRKTTNPKRIPFTTAEITSIMVAFKNNTYSSTFAVVKLSHYYPFIYFLFKTGVRKAEALQARVKLAWIS